MVMESKSNAVIFTAISIVASLFIGYLFKFDLISTTELFWVIGALILFFFVVYRQFKASEDKSELEDLKLSVKKNSERLKIYERLSKLEARFELLKNGK